MKKLGYKKRYLLIVLGILIGTILWGISFVERYPQYSAYFFPYFFVYVTGAVGTMAGFMTKGIIEEMKNKHPIGQVIQNVAETVAECTTNEGEEA